MNDIIGQWEENISVQPYILVSQPLSNRSNFVGGIIEDSIKMLISDIII